MESLEGEAEMSARFVQMGNVRELVVTNLGPGKAQLLLIEVLDQPIKLRGHQELEDLHLLKGEEHRMKAFVPWNTPSPVQVKLIWVDAGGEHSRTQVVRL